MADRYLMGVDVGTYSSKGVLVTEHGDVTVTHVVEHALSLPSPGWAEHDPEAVWWHDFLVLGLHVIAGIAMIACAVAIAFAPSAPQWWRPLAIVGAALSIAGFAVFWDGQTQLLAQEGVIGAVFSLILLASAIAFSSAFS